MLRLKATNKANTVLNFATSTVYQIVSTTGLNPPIATINTTEMATADGSVFGSARLPQRNIVLIIQPLTGIEKARNDLYAWFSPKKWVKLSIDTDSRQTEIEGYVESFDVDLYANPQLIQVSIICPDCYLSDKLPTVVDIPDTVAYAGDVPTGAEFIITLSASASTIKLRNVDAEGNTHDFTLNGTYQSSDKLYIYTETGQKDVLLERTGYITSSIIGQVDVSSDWIQLYPGNNVIILQSGSGSGKLEFKNKYMGV